MMLVHVCSICRTEWEAEGVPTDKDLCPTCSPEFKEFQKIPRLSRDIVITEKIDGTNGLIYIDENNNIFAGSRKRWLSDHQDNFGFWHWVMDNKIDLIKLGKGYHYGEWMGKGIQRNYGLNEKRFYLFNVRRWCMYYDVPKVISVNQKTGEKKYQECAPICCYVVPVLYEGLFIENAVLNTLDTLKKYGSATVKGFMNPEGIVIYHKAGGYFFKKTIKDDDKAKGQG